jgi:Rod binding domain-containing protein
MNVLPLNPQIDASQIAPERLAHNSKLTDQQKIAEASRQFESILLKQILESSQKTVIKSKLTEDSTASGIYHDMVTTQLADSISKSGKFGITQTFEGQLNHPHGRRPDGLSDKKLSRELHSTAHELKPLHESKKDITSTTSPRPSPPFHGGEGVGMKGAAALTRHSHKFVSK